MSSPSHPPGVLVEHASARRIAPARGSSGGARHTIRCGDSGRRRCVVLRRSRGSVLPHPLLQQPVERTPRLACNLIRISHGRLELAVVEPLPLDPGEWPQRRPRQHGRLDDKRRLATPAPRFRPLGRPHHGGEPIRTLGPEQPTLREVRDFDGDGEHAKVWEVHAAAEIASESFAGRKFG